jgi:hypothetical protein
MPLLDDERPDLRQIGFSIQENLGFLIFKPTLREPLSFPLPCEMDWDYDEAIRLPGEIFILR